MVLGTSRVVDMPTQQLDISRFNKYVILKRNFEKVDN